MPSGVLQSAKMRQVLLDRFTEDELQTLCVDAGLRYDHLPGNNMPAKAREFVDYFSRRNDLMLLAQLITTARSDVQMQDLL